MLLQLCNYGEFFFVLYWTVIVIILSETVFSTKDLDLIKL